MASSGPAAHVSASKADTVYAAIKSRVLDGTYPPGYRLAMSSLAAEFGVSPIPVREAVRRLEAESLVLFERNIGARVAGVDLDDYVWTFEILAILESAAAGMSADQLTADDLAEARRLNERLADAVGDSDPRHFRLLHQQLHEVLIRRCQNPNIVELVARSWSRLRSRGRLSEDRALACVAEDAGILDLIEAGASAAEIEDAIRAHHLTGLANVRADLAAG